MRLRLPGLEVVTEHRFDSEKRSRLDYAVPSLQVGAEVHGGAWLKGPDGLRGGAHHRPEGRLRDMRKIRRAQELGWVVGEFEPEELPGILVEWVVARCEERRKETR